MKGFIFTLDAILALIAAALMITSSYFYLTGAQASEWGILDLNNMATDSLAALEINNDLENVITSGSASTLDTYLNSMLPGRMCGRIRVFNSARALLYSSMKTGCNISTTKTIAVSFRSFMAQDSIYYAKMEGWYEF